MKGTLRPQARAWAGAPCPAERRAIQEALKVPARAPTLAEREYDELETAMLETSARYERLLLRQAELASLENRMAELETRVGSAILAVERFVVSLEPGSMSEPQRRQMARALEAAGPALQRAGIAAAPAAAAKKRRAYAG